MRANQWVKMGGAMENQLRCESREGVVGTGNGRWRLETYYTETLSYDTPLMYPPFSEDFTLVKNWSLSLRRSSAASGDSIFISKIFGFQSQCDPNNDTMLDRNKTHPCSVDHPHLAPKIDIADRPWRNWGSELVSSLLEGCSDIRSLLGQHLDGISIQRRSESIESLVKQRK